MDREKYLIENYMNKTTSQLAKELGIGKTTVITLVKKLGLKKNIRVNDGTLEHITKLFLKHYCKFNGNSECMDSLEDFYKFVAKDLDTSEANVRRIICENFPLAIKIT